MINKKKYYIHASNIAGLGSMSVAFNILKSFSKSTLLNHENLVLLLPKTLFWEENISFFNKNWIIIFSKRSSNKYIRFLYRAYEIIFGHLKIRDVDVLIVLGDFPLKFKKQQIVLFHNLQLIDNNFSFLFHKYFFKLNLKYITKLIVQSEVVKYSITQLYPSTNSKIKILPMPVDEIFNASAKRQKNNDKLECFYPASFYKHKNHRIIIDLCSSDADILSNIHFYLTIEKKFEENFKSTKLGTLTNLGTLSQIEVLEIYYKIDVLVFPSLVESYGLPLVEAMKMNLFIICADLPYARWLCGDQAKYFIPNDLESLKSAIAQILIEKNNRKYPNWEIALSKIPLNWDLYANQFLN
jgi:glycosyltransferase involved in cell wall biosynthesis